MSQKSEVEQVRRELLDAVTSLVESSKRVETRLGTLADETENRFQHVIAATKNELASFRNEITKEQAALRAFLIGKIDHLQGTVDLLREDVRTNWQQADFAITTSRNSREDINNLSALISTMQRQHQVLASQVEELRKAAQERDAGLK